MSPNPRSPSRSPQYFLKRALGISSRCAGGVHWACSGRSGRGRGDTPRRIACPCTCHIPRRPEVDA